MPVSTDLSTPSAYVGALRDRIDVELSKLATPAEPADLYDPVRYVLASGGKRLRPVLVLLAARIAGADEQRALPAALAVEVFHNFTLVHDDIMDHAYERRGRQTVHVKWDESTAILAGDYLLALSYDLLARTKDVDLSAILRAYHRMVARLCEGQTLDKMFERRQDVGVEEYFDMIYAKTGALLECCLELGGLVGGAREHDLSRMKSIGRHVGRAFQVQDDLLDLVAEDERWGKTIGGDLIEGKKTFLLLRALERSSGEERAWFGRIVQRPGLQPDLVDEARERMRRLGVLDDADQMVHHHTEAALRELSELSDAPAADAMRWLIESMRKRAH